MKSLIFGILSTLLIACSASAQSEAEDIRAVFSGADGALEMTLEYSKEGQLRGKIKGQAMWLLRLEGVNYFIIPREGGADVLDMRIASKLMREVLPENLPSSDRVQFPLREDGPTIVNGREGTGFRFESSPQSGPFLVVISHDPALARLGEAVYQQMKSSVELNPLAGNSASQMLEVLASGTAISFAGADLISFEETELDQSIFELPSEPLNEADSRALMVETNMIPSERIQSPDLTQH